LAASVKQNHAAVVKACDGISRLVGQGTQGRDGLAVEGERFVVVPTNRGRFAYTV
jgi:hypothetical protein